MICAHFLVRTIYLPRFLGFTLAVVLTVLLRGQHLVEDPAVLLFLCLLLIYPHAMFEFSRRYCNSDQGARLSMLADSVLVGLLLVVNQFYLYAIVAYVSFLTLSIAVIAGPALVLGNLFVMASVAVICGWATAWVNDASKQAEAAFALALLVYPGFVAWQVFRVTKSLGIARRRERVGRQTFQITTERLRRYISPQLFKTLLDTSADRVTSRRRLTVCFTDLTGFTSLMDSFSEDVITRVLNEYLNAMAEIAIHHGGTVDKFMGDGVMIFFGDPDSRGHQQDATACVRMALQMRGRLASMSRGWRDSGIANELKMRIGIHSGYCAVGNFGSEHRMDYTAVGGTVNIASRLEGYAEPNAILLSKTTAMLVGDAIDIEPLELAQLKGILRPIDIYRVVGERRGPRFKDLKEEVPGLSIEMTSSEVDLAAARALLEHCLCLLIQQEEVKQDNEPVVRLLR